VIFQHRADSFCRTATLECAFTDMNAATCIQARIGGGNIDHSTTTVGASQMLYQAVAVTATMNATATGATTVTVEPTTSSTSSIPTSTAGAQTVSGPWAVPGLVGAGLVALAAL